MLRRTALDAAYLTLALGTSLLALTVWVLALALTLSLAVFIVGLPIAIGSAYVLRWTAELDRRNARLVFGRPVRGRYRDHRGDTLLGRLAATLRDPQVWRDLGWLITHSVVGFAFGVVAITLVATVAGLATLPAWYWSVPDGVEFGLWQADSLPIAAASALLSVPLAFVTAYVLRGLARFPPRSPSSSSALADRNSPPARASHLVCTRPHSAARSQARSPPPHSSRPPPPPRRPS